MKELYERVMKELFDFDRDMVLIEGGKFLMGALETDEFAGEDTKPQHEVELSSFYMSRYDVTNKLWKFVMGTIPSDWKYNNFPVTNVSWLDIKKGFLPKFNKITGKKFTLPTEAQWEYVARGGQKSKGCVYAGSDYLEEIAWFHGNSGSSLHSVGKKKPNELGVYDIIGNVCVWCLDWYRPRYYRNSPKFNPAGGKSGKTKVLRGSDFVTLDCNIAIRCSAVPKDCDSLWGFRIVLNL